MIEINLLPGGARKKASSAGSSVDFAALLAGLSARLGDKVLIGSVAIILVAVGLFSYLYYRQGNDRAIAEARLEKAIADSTRFAKVEAARAVAEAKRDTVLRQVNLIRAIDDDRYIWPHIMDEVSRVLPAYTWLTILGFGGTPAGSANVVAAPPPPKANPLDSGKVKKKPPLQTGIPRDAVTIRLTGRTVDIQAMTRFMKDLESSPFFANVYNESTKPSGDRTSGEFFQFQLIINYTRPDSTAVSRLPLIATQR